MTDEESTDHGGETSSTDSTADPRWPRWVYGAGEEPDYRFSFANERTFLAWIRTSLALLAGGVALHLVTDLPGHAFVAAAVITLAVAGAMVAFWRWAVAERAMRRQEPLHGFSSGGVFAAGVAGLAVLLFVVLVLAE